MDKITAIKIRYTNNTYSDKIPFTVLARNVDWNENKSLVDILGTVDLNKNIQDQITQLYNNKVSSTELHNYVNAKINNNITSWLDQNVEPVGSAVIVNKTLDISGAAADAKATGDQINSLKEDITLAALSISQIANINVNKWEKGILRIDDGEPTSSEICVYTPNYYVISPMASMEFLGEKINHQYYIYFYKKDKTFLYRSNNYSIPEDAAFVRFTYGFTSASGITIDSYGGIDEVVSDWNLSYISPIDKIIFNTTHNSFELYKQSNWESGGYNTTSTTIKQTDYDQIERIKIKVLQKQQYKIKSHGSATYASWAITDQNFTILRKSSDPFIDETVTININEKYLFINALKADEHFIYLLHSDEVLSLIKETQKNIENNLNNCERDIYNYTKNKRIDSWIQNKYVPCNTSPVDLSNIQENQKNWRYTILECQENDAFTVTIRGGSTPKAWCFIDANYNILSKCQIATLLENQTIIAPKNSAYLILNDTYKQGISYYGEFLYKTLEKNIDTIENNLNNCERDIYNYTKNKRIDSWIQNKYVPCNTSPVDLSNIQNDQETWRYVILQCQENDAFTVTIRGGSVPKAWCFTDTNYNILSNCQATTLLKNQTIIAPKNSAYLILNDTYRQGISYYGEFLYKTLERKINNITINDNICPINTISKTSQNVTYTPLSSGGYKINGTATAASYYLLFNSQFLFPANMSSGKTYYIDYTTDNLGIQLQFLTYIDGTLTTFATLNHSDQITIPDNATGLIIRLWVGTNIKVTNSIVYPKIYDTNSLSYIKLIKNKTTKPMLSIIYDDGVLDFQTYIMPIILSKKVPIATAIVPEMIEENTSSLMTWNQIIECYNNGAEVLTHFKSYPEAEWENFDSQDLSYRYLKSRNQIYSHGIHTPNVLVFSGASSKTPVARRAAMRIFNGGFNASHGGINYYNHIDPYFINRYGTDNETLETLKGWIDNLIAQGTGWMVWTRHNSNATSEDQTIAAQILSNAIDYALSLNVQIVTIERGIAEYLDMY